MNVMCLWARDRSDRIFLGKSNGSDSTAVGDGTLCQRRTFCSQELQQVVILAPRNELVLLIEESLELPRGFLSHFLGISEILLSSGGKSSFFPPAVDFGFLQLEIKLFVIPVMEKRMRKRIERHNDRTLGLSSYDLDVITYVSGLVASTTRCLMRRRRVLFPLDHLREQGNLARNFGPALGALHSALSAAQKRTPEEKLPSLA